MVTLETVEIPGFREAIKRENHVRDTSFLEGRYLLCGVEVEPLSLRRLIWLENAHNGFVVPWDWDDDGETFAHAIQFLYFVRPDYLPPMSPRESFWQSFRAGWKEQRFINRMARKNRNEVIAELSAFIKDAFMDGPKGGGGGEVMPPRYVSYPVHIVDLFSEAGMTFSYTEIMDMPLARLWQFYRIAAKRINGATLTNPSDEIAVNHLAKGAA